MTELIDIHVPNERKTSVAIKIPTYKSFEESKNVQLQFASSFKLLSASKPLNETPKFDSFDVGSNWILIYFVSELALNAFAKIVSILAE